MSTAAAAKAKNAVVLKVGMVGDAAIGKTSLMVKYIEGSYDEDYIATLGVNFMEKNVTVRNVNITFSIWDLGGKKEFMKMLPLVCSEASAILFMFDLTRQTTLNSVKDWYLSTRQYNKTAIPFLIGTKFDLFVTQPEAEQAEVCAKARKFAKSMKAPLIFSSASVPINVKKIFKIVLSKSLDIKCTIEQEHNAGQPLCEY